MSPAPSAGRGVDAAGRRRIAYYRRRAAVIDHYGGRCACCGEREPAFLTLDHIQGGGRQQVRELGIANLAVWLAREGYLEGYQVLCWNCNAAKHICGTCPHVTDPGRRAAEG